QFVPIVHAVEWIYNKLSGCGTHFAEGFDNIVQGMADETKAAFKQAGEDYDHFMSGENSKKAAQFFQGIQDGAKKTAEAVSATSTKPPIDIEGLKAAAESAKKI